MWLIVVGADNERLNNRLRNIGENPAVVNTIPLEVARLREDAAKFRSITLEKDAEIAILSQRLQILAQ